MICMYEDQCDFYVLWNGQCCFGNFDNEGPQFTTDAVSQTGVYFKQGNEEISIPNYFETKNGDENNPTMGLMHEWYWQHNIYYR